MLTVVLLGFCVAGAQAAAQSVAIAPDLTEAQVTIGSDTVTIARGQDVAAMLTGDYALTQRACPPHCIQPAEAAPGVATIAELEVIAHLQNTVATGQGLLIDNRLPAGFASGSLPGAVNVPFATLAPENTYRDELLKAMGATVGADGVLDFTTAKTLVLFCDGNWSDQSTLAIGYLIAAGYPVDKMKYYRGGVQDWLHLGLTATVAAN